MRGGRPRAVARRRSIALAAGTFASVGWAPTAQRFLPQLPAYAASPNRTSLAGKDPVLEDIRDDAEMIARGSDKLKDLEDARLLLCREQKAGSEFDSCFFFGAARQPPSSRRPPTW